MPLAHKRYRYSYLLLAVLLLLCQLPAYISRSLQYHFWSPCLKNILRGIQHRRARPALSAGTASLVLPSREGLLSYTHNEFGVNQQRRDGLLSAPREVIPVCPLFSRHVEIDISPRSDSEAFSDQRGRQPIPLYRRGRYSRQAWR